MSDPAQFMPELVRGNAIRLRRAALHRRVRELPTPEGRAELARVLASPLEPSLRNATADEVLRWVRRGQPRFRRETLWAIDASETRRLGDLTLRQLDALRISIARYESTR